MGRKVAASLRIKQKKEKKEKDRIGQRSDEKKAKEMEKTSERCKKDK